ncbi:MAG: ATP-binding protein [Gammaproteobacteria bacterium]|nr:ATP-binding protein [Gammaproteobacteria bacterium]
MKDELTSSIPSDPKDPKGHVNMKTPSEVQAMLDRLLHRCHVVDIQDSSYRMREY